MAVRLIEGGLQSYVPGAELPSKIKAVPEVNRVSRGGGSSPRSKKNDEEKIKEALRGQKEEQEFTKNLEDDLRQKQIEKLQDFSKRNISDRQRQQIQAKIDQLQGQITPKKAGGKPEITKGTERIQFDTTKQKIKGEIYVPEVGGYIRASEPSGQATGYIRQPTIEEKKVIIEKEIAGNLYDIPIKDIKDPNIEKPSEIGFGFGSNKPKIPTDKIDNRSTAEVLVSSTATALGIGYGSFFSDKRPKINVTEPRFGTIYTNPVTMEEEPTITKTRLGRSDRESVKFVTETATELGLFYPKMAGGSVEYGVESQKKGEGFFYGVGKFAVERPIESVAVMSGGIMQLWKPAEKGFGKLVDDTIKNIGKDVPRGLGKGSKGKAGTLGRSRYDQQLVYEKAKQIAKEKGITIEQAMKLTRFEQALATSSRADIKKFVERELKKLRDNPYLSEAEKQSRASFLRQSIKEARPELFETTKEVVKQTQKPTTIQTTKQENVLGTKPQTRTATTQKPETVSLQAPESVVGLKSEQETLTKPRTTTIVGTSPQTKVTQDTKTNQDTMLKPRVTTKSILDTQQTRRNDLTKSDNVFDRPQKPKDPIPKPKKPKIPDLDGSLIKKVRKIAKEPELFEVFIKKSGKDVEIGTAKTKVEAKGILKKGLKGTLSASGFIEKSGQKIKAKELNLGVSFRTSKVDPFRVVEKKSKRLRRGTTGKQIQYFRKRKTKGAKFGI